MFLSTKLALSMIEIGNKGKESQDSQLLMGRRLEIRGSLMEKSSLVSKCFVSSEVLIFASAYSILDSAIESWREGGIGTWFGGIYLRISTDIATTVNAKSVPTLTCKRRKAKYI